MTSARHIALAMLLIAGCTGSYQPIPDPDRIPDDEGEGEMTEGQRLFDSEVQPVLRAKCAICHAAGAAGTQPKFLGQAEGSDYDEIVKYPSVTGNFDAGLAGVLSKITTTDHYAVTYTADEQQALRDWLAAEALERGDGDDDGDIDQLPSVNPLAEWAGCMSLEDWAASNMGRWAEKETAEDGPCLTCHDDGLARFFATGEDVGMFAMNRYELYIIGFFTVKVEPDGSQTVVPALGKLRRMGRGNFHPNYLTDEEGDPDFAGLQQFYDLTMSRRESGQCGPVGFPPPPEI